MYIANLVVLTRQLKIRTTFNADCVCDKY